MDVELLIRHFSLASLPRPVQEELAEAFIERSLVRDQVLFEVGERRDAMIVVLEGEIELDALLAEHNLPMIIFQPFDIISATSLVDAVGAHHQRAWVRSDSARVAELSHERFQALMARYPEIAPALLGAVIQAHDGRLDHANLKLLSLVSIAEIAMRSRSFGELGAGVLPVLVSAMRCQYAMMLRLVADQWVVVASHGMGGESLWKPGHVVLEDRVLKAVRDTRTSQWLTGAGVADLAQYQSKEFIVSVCGQKTGTLVGALVIGDRVEGSFSASTVLHMETVAQIVASGMMRLNEQEYQKSEEQTRQEYVLPFS